MLNPEVREFLENLKTLKAVGCALAPRKRLTRIRAVLQQEGVIPCYEVRPGKPPPHPTPPSLLLASEEDYSSHPDWAEELRDRAGYFLNLE